MQPQKKDNSWVKVVARYQTPDTRIALGQVLSSFGPFVALQALMYALWPVAPWLIPVLAVFAGGFLVRIFIILHDCGHGSFTKNQRLNDIFGIISGVFTLTPYYQWRHGHAIHHATSGDLDRRGIGDVDTLTVREYVALPWWRRLAYRVYRFPLFMFGLGAVFLFVVINRFAAPGSPRREVVSTHATSLAIAGAAALMVALVGWQAFLAVYGLSMAVAAVGGVWLFYLQHQFEATYWKPHPEWDYYMASIKGSSFYQLPKILQWFTGNIGFHHIHHLSPKIPNYRLEQCFRENAQFHDVTTLTLASSLETLQWRLWDEDLERMVGFARAADYARQHKTAPAPASGD